MKTKQSAPDCPICEASNWIDGTHQLELTHQKQSLYVADLLHSECVECGYELIFPHQTRRNEALIRDARREASGLLTSSRIKAIRKRLRLSQQQFAVLIGCGINTFSKYERGEVTQSAAMDKLLRVLDVFPEAQNVLERQNKPLPKRKFIYESGTLPAIVRAGTEKSFKSREGSERIRPFSKAA